MLKVKVTSNFQNLDEVQRALGSLDGTIATLKFNPKNPASVQDAIRQMETAVDQRVAPYAGNALVIKLAEAMKARYREHVLKRASEVPNNRPPGRDTA